VEPWELSTNEDLVRAIMRFASVRKQLHRARGSAAASAPISSSPLARKG
jgi:hypothetical protein